VLAYLLGSWLRQRADPARYRGWLKAMPGVMASALVLSGESA
jgi:hypothetical protein